MIDKPGRVAVAAAVLMLSSIGVAIAEEGAAAERVPAPAERHHSPAERHHSPAERHHSPAERHHSIDVGLGGLAGAGSLSYEYRWARDRGLLIELHGLRLPVDDRDRERVGGVIGLALEASGLRDPGPDASTGFGAAIGHRWHWREHSGFFGLHAGFDLASSSYAYEGSRVEHGMLYLVGNIGRRWELGHHVHLTARLGAGIAYRYIEYEQERDLAVSVRLVDELVDTLPITLDAELSVGYAF